MCECVSVCLSVCVSVSLSQCVSFSGFLGVWVCRRVRV